MVEIVNLLADSREIERVEYWARFERMESIRSILSWGTGIFVAILINSYFRRKKMQRKQDKEMALRLGNVITAKLVRVRTVYDKKNHKTYRGQYEYEVYGEKKYKTVDGTGATLMMYYVHDPHKAFSDYDDYGLMVQFSLLAGFISGLAISFLLRPMLESIFFG